MDEKCKTMQMRLNFKLAKTEDVFVHLCSRHELFGEVIWCMTDLLDVVQPWHTDHNQCFYYEMSQTVLSFSLDTQKYNRLAIRIIKLIDRAISFASFDVLT